MLKRLTIIVIILGSFFWVFNVKAVADTCPRDNGAGVGCDAGSGYYYCSNGCRNLTNLDPPSLSFCADETIDRQACAPNADCTNASSYPCGIPESCNSGYTLCNLDGTGNASWPNSKCKLNTSIPAGCSSYNQCTSVCSACSAGYELISGECFGATVRLGQDSVTSTYLKNSTNPLLTILSSGNVGIGITAPEASLDVFGGNGFINAYNTQLGALGGAGEAVVMTDDSGNLFSTSTVSFMDANTLWSGTRNGNIWNGDAGVGNVGIGTTTPQNKLDVAGHIRAYGGVVQSYGTSITHYVFTMNAIAGDGPRLQLGNSQNAGAFFEIGAWANINNFDSKNRKLSFYTDGHPAQVFLDTNGNVGIGTTDPIATLDVDGTSGIIQSKAAVITGFVNNPGIVMSDSSGILYTSSDSGIAKYATSTPLTYDGNRGSYTDANSLCNAVVSGSHVCTSEEILYTINSGNTSNIPFGSTLWINNGPPAYTANANDCQGWTSNASGDYGTVWNKLSTGDGFGSLDHCNVNPAHAYACCK